LVKDDLRRDTRIRAAQDGGKWMLTSRKFPAVSRRLIGVCSPASHEALITGKQPL
jgi:hypothetical protein